MRQNPAPTREEAKAYLVAVTLRLKAAKLKDVLELHGDCPMCECTKGNDLSCGYCLIVDECQSFTALRRAVFENFEFKEITEFLDEKQAEAAKLVGTFPDHLTLDEVKALNYRDGLVFIPTGDRWRVNGKVKLWKRDQSRVRVPIKYGLYDYFYIDENNYQKFRTE